MNFIFAFIFFIEMVAKILGLGLKGYFKDKFNVFDFVVVIMSSIDVALTLSNFNTIQGSSAISALRAFRLLRVFKLAKTWKQFYAILSTI